MTREQFTAYVEKSQAALRRFLTGLCCGDSSLADDIAQETYIKAYLASDTFRNEAKFTTWLHRIAYNTFVSHRRSKTDCTQALDEAVQIAGDERADSSFRYQRLYAALAQLTANERTALLLYYIQGFAIKEISEITQNSQEAVKQHLSRGRQHLRRRLGSDIL